MQEQMIDADKESFEELFNESNPSDVGHGRIVKGVVLSISKDSVFINIGYKSEGAVPLKEFLLPDGTVGCKVGDEVDVFVNARQNEAGNPSISKRKADMIRGSRQIMDVFNSEEKVISGTIIDEIKGGYSVDVAGVQAFLPKSQLDVVKNADFSQFKGKALEFKIMDFDPKKKNLVVSRRALLEEKHKREREAFFSKTKLGDVVKGVVKTITNFGVFLDLGGIDGLLPLSEISHGKISNPSEVFSPGQEVQVKIIKLDPHDGKISLSLKQMSPDPWISVSSKYVVGEKVSGKVVNIAAFGVFIELEPGIDGLIHLSELSWTKKVNDPKSIFQLGDTVSAVVLNVDLEKKKIALGYRQTLPNPWDDVVSKYKVGDVFSGVVKNVSDFGAFVEVEEGVDALLHVSDISWTKNVKSAVEVLKKGDTVTVKIINIDSVRKKMAVGMKQMEEDPFKNFSDKTKGDIKANIRSIDSTGLILDLPNGVEGFVPIAEIPKHHEGSLSLNYKAGDEIMAKLVLTDKKAKRVVLSINAYDKEHEKNVTTNYLKNQKDAKLTFGNVFEKHIQENKNN